MILLAVPGSAWAKEGVPAAPRLSPFVAQATPGTDEPTPKSGDEPQLAPGGKSSEEPGGKSAEEPGGKPPAGEPTEPVKPGAATVVAKPKGGASYGVGFQVRGIFVPAGFLEAFLAKATSLNSASIGAEIVRHKGNFDLVGSINFGFYSPQDGNYLGKGEPIASKTDYVQFRNLNLLAFDVAFIWHHDFNRWLSLVYGAGLGFGIVLGDVYRISNYDGNCTPENLSDFSRCNPVSPDLAHTLDEWNRSRDAWLAKYGKAQSGGDSSLNPHLYREEGVWPVVPVVHLLVGVNFKISDQFSVRVDGGFHNAFYVGATGHYFFFL
jgi:hypothetical protein